MHGRGGNLKDNIGPWTADQNVSCFIQKKKFLTEFALKLRYEVDISFERTLLPVFPIHTKSKYQFQDGQIVANKRQSGDLELSV